MELRIGLDLDDTVNKFMEPYYAKFGYPRSNKEIAYDVENILIKDKEFWLNLPIYNRMNFIPTLYCTKRVHSKKWSKQYLEINNLPVRPIYQVKCYTASKAPKIKGKVDVFIDDSIDNFIDLNLKGIPCLLMDTPFNKEWGPIGRVFSLDLNEIEDCYHLFMLTVFPKFKNLL